MDPLAQYLAREARRLGLESMELEDAPTETIAVFAQCVLSELAALGLLRGRKEVGCWAVPRVRGH
ncbi:hypothetical protein [Deinococcus aerolatus]|uniref:hypothetical protein n=1 Tax=Deinococcus aerolatus TaxID=522487 RepID=UPI001666CE8D|nr:hypothetical protein [Deinococcus aerolatus]